MLPESEDIRTLKATQIVLKEKYVNIVLVGNEEIIKQKTQENNINIEGATIINPQTSKDYEKYAGCCFMVCDQPLLQKQSLQKLFESFYRNPEGIHMCVTKEREGNPVIFPKILFEELMALEGDKGGKRIAKEHPEMIYKVYVTEQELSDMDYQEDKINLEKNII